MNKRTLFLLLFALFALPILGMGQVYSSLFEGENIKFSRAIGERLSKSDEKAKAQIFRDYFKAEGIVVLDSPDDSSFGIMAPNGDTLIHYNSLGFIQGYDRKLKDSYIVISTPIGEDISGMLALMSLAKMLKTNSVLLRRSIILAAFGAGETLQNAGSWYFLNRSFAKDANHIEANVELYLLGDGANGFNAYTPSYDGLYNLLNQLKGTLQPIHPQYLIEEATPTDHRSFSSNNIPIIQFISGRAPYIALPTNKIDYENLERETEYIYNYVLALANEQSICSDGLNSAKKALEPVSWNDCDVKPAFMNNTDPSVFLERWVYTYLKYPQYAIDNGIQGRVLVDFVIDERGKVIDAMVRRGVHSALDQEALKVVLASPDWRPARVRGKKVPCRMSIYIEFRLKKK